ncbi:MAG: LamG domain-containing protein [Cyclobacteriaceae bacterium]
MTKIELLTVLLLIVSTGSFCQDITTDLVAKWDLDGDFLDGSGNAFNGSAVGNPSAVADHNGDPGKAIYFDGDDKILTSTAIDDQLSGGATFSAWINIDDVSNGTSSYLTNYNGNGSPGNCNGRIGFISSVNNQGAVSIFYLIDGDDYDGRSTPVGTIQDNTWYHVVTTWDGLGYQPDNFKIYVDKARSDSQNQQDGNNSCGGFQQSNQPFMIGTQECSGGYCATFKGSIDDVAIYGRELSQADIDELYSPSSSSPEPTTSSLWKPSGNNVFYDDGQVAIGSETFHTDTTYRLAIDGKAIMEEVKVQVKSQWPDYVFKTDYELPELSKLEQFVKDHHRLPGIPSAEEVSTNGIQLGEMNRLLLQKIEELTLHTIAQQKLIAQQRLELEKVLRRIEILENKNNHH